MANDQVNEATGQRGGRKTKMACINHFQGNYSPKAKADALKTAFSALLQTSKLR